MRYVNTLSLHQLGLSADELAFLKPLAEKRHEQFCEEGSIASNRGFSEQLYGRGRFGQPDHYTVQQRIEAEVNHALVEGVPTSKRFRQRETEVDADGFGLEHSSYGAVSVTRPNGSREGMVGSASLFGYYFDVHLGFGEVCVRDSREPALRCDREMLTLSLSPEQFVQLQRVNNEPVPCRLDQVQSGFTDTPPVLAAMLAKEKDIETRIKALCRPFNISLNALGELLKAGVSKQAERNAVMAKLEEAKAHFAEARKAIDALTESESELEIERVERQFNAEVQSRMSTLGLSHMADVMPLLR